MAFVEFRDVSKIYKMGEVSVAAVDGMNFDIEAGELVVVAWISLRRVPSNLITK